MLPRIAATMKTAENVLIRNSRIRIRLGCKGKEKSGEEVFYKTKKSGLVLTFR